MGMQINAALNFSPHQKFRLIAEKIASRSCHRKACKINYFMIIYSQTAYMYGMEPKVCSDMQTGDHAMYEFIYMSWNS